MKQQHLDYQVVPYPKMRRLEALAYRSVQHKPMIHDLIKVDVTRARVLLRDHKAKTGESLSFTAFLIAILFMAVDVVLIVNTLASHAPVDSTTHASWIADFTVQLPALLVAGIPWKRGFDLSF